MKPRQGAARLLFVDDDPQVRRTFARTMEREGFVVDVAADADEALALANRHRYPVIATDLMLPGISGTQLAERLKTLQPQARYVLLSGASGLRDASAQGAVRWHSVVPKPWDHSTLASLLREAARRERQILPERELQTLLVAHPRFARAIQRLVGTPALSLIKLQVVGDLAQARHRLSEGGFDLVLCDLSLCEGLQGLAGFAGHCEQAALVVFGPDGSERAALSAINHGAQEYLVRHHLSARGLGRAVRYAVERKRVERKLHHLAHHDPLTGLPNRARFQARVAEVWARASETHRGFGVLFTDLDRFKAVNDTFGHDVGDLLLQEVAERLRDAVAGAGFVSRLGGDEFAVLVDPISEPGEAHGLAQRIREAFEPRFRLRGIDLDVSCSVGVSTYPESANDVESLLRTADAAMYRDKAARVAGRMQEPGARTGRILAVGRGYDDLYRVDAAERRFADRGRGLHSMRANLIRREDGRSILPGAEASLVDLPLLTWTLDQAMRWGPSTERICLPVPARHLVDPVLVDRVRRATVQASGRFAVELEIEEPAWHTIVQQGAGVLAALREHGARIAIGGYRAALVPLSVLARGPVDTVVLCPTLFREPPSDPRSRGLVESLVASAVRLGVEVVAPAGVGRRWQRLLRADGCAVCEQAALLSTELVTPAEPVSGHA